MNRWIAVLVALGALLTFAASAQADSATITFNDAAGKDDPVVDVGRTLTLTGNTAATKSIFVKWRATGGAPCAPSAGSDAGSTGLMYSGGYNTSIYGRSYNGNFAIQQAGVWRYPGTYQFCIWIADRDNQPVTPITQVISFRQPGATVGASLSPAAPVEGGPQPVLTITGTAEAPERVYATLGKAGSAACGASAGSDTGGELLEVSSDPVSGNFSLQAGLPKLAAGGYRACLWLTRQDDPSATLAGPQVYAFTVAAPPSPCVVPNIGRGTSLADATDQLTKAGCSLGALYYSPSRSVARGAVIKVKGSSGGKLAHGTPVALVVSNGAPCVVPLIRPGTTIKTATARLTASGCTVGSVRSIASRHVRAGRVVSLSRRAGTRLAPKAALTIFIAKRKES